MQANMTHSPGGKPSVEIVAEVTGMMELADKALKNSVVSMPQVPKKVEENTENMRKVTDHKGRVRADTRDLLLSLWAWSYLRGTSFHSGNSWNSHSLFLLNLLR